MHESNSELYRQILDEAYNGKQSGFESHENFKQENENHQENELSWFPWL
jgi:hypothetical protein